MNRILTLQTEGQSIWLDYIERGMVQSGELQQLVDEGVTVFIVYTRSRSALDEHRLPAHRLERTNRAVDATGDQAASPLHQP